MVIFKPRIVSHGKFQCYLQASDSFLWEISEGDVENNHFDQSDI